MDLGVLIAQVPFGPYASVWKAIPPIVLLFFWAKLLTWVDKDAPNAHLPRWGINAGFVGGLILGFILFLAIPPFLGAFGALFGVLLVEIGVYLIIRNQKVGLSDLKGELSNMFRSTPKEKKIKLAEGQVLFLDKAGRPIPPPASDDDPQLEPYQAAQEILTEPLRKGAQAIQLTPAEGGSAVRYSVDGVFYDLTAMTRTTAAGAVAYLKSLAGLDLNEKRKPQTGTFRVSIDNKRRDIQISTAGSSAGESLSLSTDFKTRHSLRVEELGLPADQHKKLLDVIHENTGVVLLSAPPDQGLTSLLYAVIRAHDAFLSHILTIERDPEQDLEGITQNKLPANATGAEEAKLVSWVIDQQPDVIMMSRVDDARSAVDLAKFAGEEHRVYIGLRATSTFDALTQWRKLIGDDKLALKNLRMIVNGRVLRKLCMACKVGYSPDPSTLRKLNMDPDKISKLYQARTEPLRDPKGRPIPCDFCHDLRFKGRTGVYEMLLVDDDVRQVVQSGGSINQLKAVFRKQRAKYLQEQALVQVETGDTSIQEVLRVLKSSESQSQASRPSAGPRQPAA